MRQSRMSAVEPCPPGTEFLDAETEALKSPPETNMSSQRPEGAETDVGNPGTNGRSELDRKIPGSEGLGGGHDRDRTCDPYHVKVVLSR
jgi:hypothetical protein